MSLPVKENRKILTDRNGAQIIAPEGASGPLITMTLLDETGAAVPLASIATATLTIYARDEAGSPRINAVDREDVKNVGRGTIHATSGLLTLMLEADDNSLHNTANDLEWHRCVIEIGYAGTKVLKYELEYPVRNLS